jgi:hypothetical protein
MAGKYWIKLYTEILDDPKMGLLPDHIWRRAIEIFLIAGRHGQEGELPKVSELAYILHASEQEITSTFEELAKVEMPRSILPSDMQYLCSITLPQ